MNENMEMWKNEENEGEREPSRELDIEKAINVIEESGFEVRKKSATEEGNYNRDSFSGMTIDYLENKEEYSKEIDSVLLDFEEGERKAIKEALKDEGYAVYKKLYS